MLAISYDTLAESNSPISPEVATAMHFARSCSAATNVSFASPAAWSRMTARPRTWCRKPTCAPSPPSPGFGQKSSLFTWLTQIALNEARGRLRKRRPQVDLDIVEAEQERGADVIAFPRSFGAGTPESDAARTEIRRLMEMAIDELPEIFRLVFILREIEECTVEETAAQLGLLPETVKTRLFRARRLLRKALYEKLSSSVTEAFPFLGTRCWRITDAVLQRLDARGS